MSNELEAQLARERAQREAERAQRDAAIAQALADAKRILEQNGGPNG